MLTAKLKDKTILAIDSQDRTLDYRCPACNKPMILKKGEVMVHHFAHRTGGDCSYSSGESIEHMTCKYEIYKELSSIYGKDKVDVEKIIGDRRADIFVNNEYVVEIQKSNISLSEIKERTLYYSEMGYGVIWVCIYRPSFSISEGTVRLSQFHLNLLEVSNGVLFLWSGKGSLVETFRFKKYKNWNTGRWYKKERRYERGQTVHIFKLKKYKMKTSEIRYMSIPHRILFDEENDKYICLELNKAELLKLEIGKEKQTMESFFE